MSSQKFERTTRIQKSLGDFEGPEKSENQILTANSKNQLLIKNERDKNLRRAQGALRNIVSITTSIKKLHNWS